MKNLSFNYGSNVGTIVTLIPFYVEVIQNNIVIGSCYSSEGNVSVSLRIKTITFDDTIPTTIKYYNLGKNTNIINCILLNGTDFTQSADNFPTVADGMCKATLLNSNNYPNYYLSIICKELSTTPSGVTYALSGSNLVSAKTGDSSFITSSTPNVALNPNYIASSALTAPTLSTLTPLNTTGLVFGGMNEGDVVTLKLNDIASELSPTGYLSTDTANSNGQVTMYGNGIIGYPFRARYKRGTNYSAYSQEVTIQQDTGQLPRLVVTALVNNNSTPAADYYVDEEVNVTGFTTGASLVVRIDEGTGSLPLSNPPIAVENTDYTKTAITGGFKIKFLRVNSGSQLVVLFFSQSLSGHSDSQGYNVTVRPTRPATATPTVSIAGKSIIVNNVSEQFNIELWSKLGNATDFTQLGLSVAGSTLYSTYTFNNLAEGKYKVRTQQKDKKYSAFTAEQLIFLSPLIVGAVNRPLADVIAFSNVLAGDDFEIAFSANGGTSYTTTTIANITIPSQLGNNSYYFYTPTVVGLYKFRRTKNSISSTYSEVLTIANVVVSAPVLSATSMQSGGNITVSNIVSGDSLSYVKDGTTTVNIGVINAVTYSFSTSTQGNYQFRITRGTTTSVLSETLAVISGSQCVLSNLELTQNAINPSIYDVLISNPQNVVISYVLKDSLDNPLINDTLTTSASTVSGKVKAQIDFSNIIEGTNYQILFFSATTGKTCSILSNKFDFNIVNSEPVDVVLSGDDSLDCKGIFITNVTESLKPEGLEISFKVNYSSVISNDPPYFISITKADGTELFQTETEVLTTYSSGKLRCLIPYKKIPNKFTVLTLTATVSASGAAGTILSDVYSCVASTTYTVTTDTQVISKSTAPILDTITLNSTTLSFVSDCTGASGKFYVNNQVYADLVYSPAGSNLISTPIIAALKIGDVVTAKQTCPNKLESDSSGSVTILSTCTKVSAGVINGDELVLQNSVKIYSISGLQGSSPFTFETQVSGGEILSGLNTSEITVKITSNTSCVVGFKVKNCNETQSVNLTKSVTVSKIEVGVLSPPRILGLNSTTLTGVADKNVVITLYNENNEIIANNITSDNLGVWNVNNVKKQLAYYAIASFQNTKSTLSNIYVVLQSSGVTGRKDNCNSNCNNRNILI